jgi:LysR family glycine cleavage system transcriptional activator
MLTEGFEKLVDSAHRIRGANEDSTLTVWMAPSFAAKWLIPRLHRFYEACPGIDLNITASRVDKLFSVNAIPLCSPRLLEGEHPLRSPEDLRFHTLLHDDTRYEGRPDWATWLKAAAVDNVDSTHGVHFNHVNLALTAAVEGQGVVLSIKALASEDIAAGRLVIPFDIGLPLEYAYYLITLEEVTDQPHTAAFRAWLIEEARQEEEAG